MYRLRFKNFRNHIISLFLVLSILVGFVFAGLVIVSEVWLALKAEWYYLVVVTWFIGFLLYSWDNKGITGAMWSLTVVLTTIMWLFLPLGSLVLKLSGFCVSVLMFTLVSVVKEHREEVKWAKRQAIRVEEGEVINVPVINKGEKE